MTLIEKTQRPRALMNQINVVPYIDVMLVLLVIFMVTAPLINPGQIDLPQVGKTSDPPVAPMEVSVRTDGTLVAARPRAAGRRAARYRASELVAAIRQKQKQNPEQAVVIAADKDVRYEAVLEVMDMLQQNQVKQGGAAGEARARNSGAA